jgi:hypothetical protein
MKVSRIALLGFGFAVALVLAVGVSAAGKLVSIAQSDNVDITRHKGDDAEATVAINPTNPSQAFVAVNPFNAKVSSDGGLTWKKGGSGVGTSCCDNAAAWDDFGNLFLLNLNLEQDQFGNFVVDEAPLYVSTNGGKKFTKLQVMNTDPDVDQPTVKAGAGAVWATWNEAGTIMASGAAVSGLGSIDPFSRPEPVIGSGGPGLHPSRKLPGRRQPAPGSGSGVGQFGDIAIGPDGQVVVAWQTSASPDNPFDCPCEIDVNTDADGLGAGGFGSAVKVTDTNVAKLDSIAAQPTRTIDAEANLQYDRSGGAHDGRLYLVYTDAAGPPGDTGNDNTDIYIRHSDTNGATWSSAVKVNDDVTNRAQFLPYLAVDNTTGDLIVSWYDARNDPTNHDAIQYWGAFSEDGGATFLPNFQISEGASNGDAGFDPDFEFGDYSWVDFTHGLALPVWSDNSNALHNNPDGTLSGLDLYTARVEVNLCNGRQATILGTNGDDGALNGTSGDDVILGFGGNDTINGMGGNDTICGGAGNDTILEGLSPDGADWISGGAGTDTVDYSGRTGFVTVTFDGKAKSGEKKEGDAIQSDVENANAGSGGSKMTGSTAGNVLSGGAGKDSLSGRAGADTLNGSDGTGGNDTLDCGNNDGVADTFTFDAGPPTDKVKNCP